MPSFRYKLCPYFPDQGGKKKKDEKKKKGQSYYFSEESQKAQSSHSGMEFQRGFFQLPYFVLLKQLSKNGE